MRNLLWWLGLPINGAMVDNNRTGRSAEPRTSLYLTLDLQVVKSQITGSYLFRLLLVFLSVWFGWSRDNAVI
jgi:hypothetical protein